MGGYLHFPYSRPLQQHLFLMLQRCTTTKDRSQLHAQILVNGFAQKKFIIAKLLSSFAAAGDLAGAARAFSQVVGPTATLFNLMIRIGDGEASVVLYNEMRRGGAEPTGFTYSSLISACARANLKTQGQQVHARVVSMGFQSNVFVQTSLLNLYSDLTESAQRVFDEMPHRNIVSWNSMLVGHLRFGDPSLAVRLFEEMPERDVVSWTTMIAGCTHVGMCAQALALFHEMRRFDVSPDEVTIVAALSACAQLEDLQLGRWIHSHVERCHRHCLVSLGNSLIHMYAKCGDIDGGERVFNEMPRRSTITWSTIISGLAMHGRGDRALDIFQKMQSAGGVPDEATFVGVLCACSHMGRIEDGRRYFDYMIRVCRIRPRVEHYGCMVDMLSRAGQLNEARDLIETMKMEPNETMWGALLGGCRIHHDTELGDCVSHRLMELVPVDRTAGYLLLLLNSYSAEGRWDDAGRVRELMGGLNKLAGSSWIINN